MPAAVGGLVWQHAELERELAALPPQSTVTGQRAGCVAEPTFHRQLSFVPVLAPRPFALEGDRVVDDLD